MTVCRCAQRQRQQLHSQICLSNFHPPYSFPSPSIVFSVNVIITSTLIASGTMEDVVVCINSAGQSKVDLTVRRPLNSHEGFWWYCMYCSTVYETGQEGDGSGGQKSTGWLGGRRRHLDNS